MRRAKTQRLLTETGRDSVKSLSCLPESARSLDTRGVTDALVDPTLEVHDGNGAVVAQNDNWKSTQQPEIQNSGYAPPKDAEAAILATLQPGNYTAIVRGNNNTTGVALVEVYNLNAN